MAKEFSGAGDPARTLSILWGIQQIPARGPKPGLSIVQIVAAAMTIADTDDGLDSLSMRRVADELGVGTMSIYTYVPSKAELIDLMLDAAYAEVGVLPEDRTDRGRHRNWPAGLRAVADANWRLYQRHPWMLQVSTGRPALGPNAVAKYDLELSAVEGIGLTDVEMDAVISLVHSHVEGMARQKLDARLAERRSGMTDQQWWEATSPVFAEVYEPDRFPVATRVGAAAGQEHNAAHDPDHAYEFGLERLLDGIAAYVDRSTTEDPHAQARPGKKTARTRR